MINYLPTNRTTRVHLRYSRRLITRQPWRMTPRKHRTGLDILYYVQVRPALSNFDHHRLTRKSSLPVTDISISESAQEYVPFPYVELMLRPETS